MASCSFSHQAIERKDVSFWGLVAVGSPPRFLRRDDFTTTTMMWFGLVGIPWILFNVMFVYFCTIEF